MIFGKVRFQIFTFWRKWQNTIKILPPLVCCSCVTRLFNETSEAMGGLHSNPDKKQEIEDNSRKIGVVFAKLNSGDISRNAAEKLVQLCQSLDNGDFSTALQIQRKTYLDLWLSIIFSHKQDTDVLLIHPDWHT